MAEKKHPGGRPRKWKTPTDLQLSIESYFSTCDARTREVFLKEGASVTTSWPEPYTVQGLAVALDLTTEGLLEYESRPEFSATVKKAKTRIEADKARRLLDGYGYGPGFIFDLKHNHGWKDVQGIEHSGNVTLRFDKQDEAA